MRHLVLILLLIVHASHVVQAQGASSCIAPNGLAAAYKDDITDIAIERMYQIGSPDTVLIEVPQRFRDTVLRALSAIANGGAAVQADSVFNHYCVHRWPWAAFAYRRILVAVDTSYPWAKQWYNNNPVSGNAAVDDLLSRHGISMTAFLRSGGTNYARLEAAAPKNMRALADSLSRIPGVLQVDQLGSNPADWITLRGDATLQVMFHAGWDDCLSGCINQKEWYYSVNTGSCAVSLDSVAYRGFSPDLRLLANCELVSLGIGAGALPTVLRVYPNPARNVIQVEGSGTAASLQIINALGRVVATHPGGNRSIDLRTLQPGMYLLRQVPGGNGPGGCTRFVKE